MCCIWNVNPASRFRGNDEVFLIGFLILLRTFLPVWLRRASQDEVDQPRADAGEAGMPKRFQTGQGWPV